MHLYGAQLLKDKLQKLKFLVSYFLKLFIVGFLLGLDHEQISSRSAEKKHNDFILFVIF